MLISKNSCNTAVLNVTETLDSLLVIMLRSCDTYGYTEYKNCKPSWQKMHKELYNLYHKSLKNNFWLFSDITNKIKSSLQCLCIELFLFTKHGNCHQQRPLQVCIQSVKSNASPSFQEVFFPPRKRFLDRQQ